MNSRLHSWNYYVKNYGIPLRTLKGFHARGWSLDDPIQLLNKAVNGRGPTAPLTKLMEFVNANSGIPAKATIPDGDARGTITISCGKMTMSREITSAQVDQVIQKVFPVEAWTTSFAP